MSRRNRPEKRMVLPDGKYNNDLITMMINRIMRDGKKSVATHIMYEALEIPEKRAKMDPIELFEGAIKSSMPRIEVKPRRVGGSTYQVPVEVDTDRQIALCLRWLLAAARNRSGRSMADKLANELIDASKGQGAAVKKRDDTHRMAEANRAFAHFRF